jgi:hypothetical protein
MATATAVNISHMDRMQLPEQQPDTEAILSLQALAAAVLRFQAPWHEFHRALLQVSPASRRAVRESMWRQLQHS